MKKSRLFPRDRRSVVKNFKNKRVPRSEARQGARHQRSHFYRMKYAYEDLGDDQFEQLVVLLCRRLLGMGTQGFAKGVDGGRDAKFVGKAQLIPSTTAPWEGIFAATCSGFMLR